jgi:hypothetical protein
VIITVAAECENSDVTQLAQLGWPGVVALGLLLAAFVSFIWLMTR